MWLDSLHGAGTWLSTDPLIVACCATMALVLVFGGASRQAALSDLPGSLSGALALSVLLARPRRAPAPDALFAAILAAAMALPLFQLVPLPPFLWTVLPGRSVVVQTLALAGIEEPWLPLSLSPETTLRAAFGLLPALAIGLAAPLLAIGGRRMIAATVVVAACLSVVLGMVQVVGGETGWGYVHAVTNRGRAVGVFANANHLAALIYVAVPFSAALLAGGAEHVRTVRLLVLASLWLVFLLGLAASGSRSALLLGLTAFVPSYALIVRPQLPRLAGTWRWLLAGLGLAVILFLALGVGLLHILERLAHQDVADDARWAIARNGVQAVLATLPFGTGFGTFERVYPLFEAPGTLIFQTANRAHDDLLEIVIEGGAASAVLLAAFVFWFVRRCRVLWNAPASPQGRMGLAGMVAVTLLSAHSLWDYPLRTQALACCFTFACACMAAATRREAAHAGASG